MSIPELDSTMTDVYSDEPSSLNFSTTSMASARRLQAANSQHLGIFQEYPASTTLRDRSPFRNGSPLAPVLMHDFSSMSPQNKAAMDAGALQEQIARSNAWIFTPRATSPQDALLDFHDTNANSNFTTMVLQNSSGFNGTATTKTLAHSQQPFEPLQLDTITLNILQHPFISQAHQSSTVPSLTNGSLGASRMASNSHSPQRPATTNADVGTYTCTHYGCNLRFETPELMRKHRKEH
ncbi:hypothetical protein V8F33_006097 [Rhypophila sp. PSN 637]